MIEPTVLFYILDNPFRCCFGLFGFLGFGFAFLIEWYCRIGYKLFPDFHKNNILAKQPIDKGLE